MKASGALGLYIRELHKNYLKLNEILKLESDDIASLDELKLGLHIRMESETVDAIKSLTETIRTYLEQTAVGDSDAGLLKEAEELKKSAAARSKENLSALNEGMRGLKTKIASIKLPQSARRVYYSGNNPTLMDIEI